jgi:hypothetical protein
MYKIPVFLSQTQINDVLSELDKHIKHLSMHIDDQVVQYGNEAGQAEQLWLESLNGAYTALSTAKRAFSEAVDEKFTEDKQDMIGSLREAQTRLRNLGYGQKPGGYH